MINKEKLNNILNDYKKDFDAQWKDEKYKWEAIKCFQDNWNVDSSKFDEMLENSLAKSNNLLSGNHNFAKNCLIELAKEDSKTIKEAFENLFDEKTNVYVRIDNFKKTINDLKEKYKDSNWNHFQDENTITTYLWLRYPDKYYIYKTEYARNLSNNLKTDYKIIKGRYHDNIKNYIKLYDEINEYMKSDPELKKILNLHLDENCYSDPELKTLTTDFGHYVSKIWIEKPKIVKEDNTKKDESNENEYSLNDFLSEVYIAKDNYNHLVSILNRKKNIILQGAPGTGKTFAAKRLAYSIIGSKDDSKIAFVQFHQSYSYEDFVRGYRPTETGFKLENGIFYDFCMKASQDKANKYFFIIDEINRGNLSKIFGELLMLIEADHRDELISLAYKKDKDEPLFYVPSNVYIIGLMNTADRSLAIIDYALRRRFSFFEMEPAFDSEGFKKYQDSLNYELFNELIIKIKDLNKEIIEEFGSGFAIGHSYFCNLYNCNEYVLKEIVDYDILPILKEYWFDNEEKYKEKKKLLEGLFE